MKHSLAARIALRYLFAKKSHTAVTAISAVSICGIAVATAAIVCVLSVFNGFMDILSQFNTSLTPDITLTPAHGKTFGDTDSILTAVHRVAGVKQAMPIVADNALVICQGREMPVMLKGVQPDAYRAMTAIDSITLPGGRFATRDSAASRTRVVYDDDIGDYVTLPEEPAYLGDISIGMASRLEVAPGGNDAMIVFAPVRRGHFNPANPASSFRQDSIRAAGIFRTMQNDYDDNYLITDIELARDLFEYDTECTSVEINARPDVLPATLAADLSEALGPDVVVKDRLRQQALNFRMINIEKWMTFLLLTFILTVASFNVISTLSMLVLDKQGTLRTIHALGAPRRAIGAIFAWESVYVTGIGCGAGILLGVALSLLQQHFGLIHLAGDPSTLAIHVYPVRLRTADLLTVLVPISAIALVTALISSRFARTRI